MPTIHDILQFNFSPTNLKQSAQRIIPVTLSSLNEHRIDKLQKITEDLGSSSFSFSGKNLIPEVFKKFKTSFENRNSNFDRRELRTLTYSLNYSEKNLNFIFGSEIELKFALTILETNWRDSFLIGLIDCFLKNWETDFQNSLDQLEQFINSKLDNYSGNRITLLSFKKNKRFFNTKNGNLILGDILAKLNIPIQEATKILGVPESWFTYPYFSRVIVTYYEKNTNRITEEIENLDNALINHNSTITNKRLISKIIIQLNHPQFSTLQDKIKKIAFTQIGDPSNISNWAAFENSTDIEKVEIIQARNILNEWITQQFINVFFNVCINDERRKRFWLKYVSKISSFKVYGPLHTKSILKRDERISEFVDARFEIVSSKKDVSAFILNIGEYILIEFSNDGYACCAYKLNSSKKPNLNYKLNSVDDLRNSSLPLAIQSDANYYYTNEEGRLFHNENWESKFNHWLNEKVIR
jgi:hypothetical protein